MWQYQKLTTLLALGVVAVSANIGCATTVEDPTVDQQAMSEEDAAESSEALTVGGGAYRGFRQGRFGYIGRGFHGRGLYGHPGRALGLRARGYYGGFLGDCGYDCGGYGDLGDYGDYYDHDDDQDVTIIVEQNNGYGGYDGYDGYDDYEDYDDYEPCD
ncbi:MAG TPA: hypothetical protein PK156_31415 [Polyangium sp.]|nr:hypothetical protein [Polyangium sp.]